jgi:hypothetical protein
MANTKKLLRLIIIVLNVFLFFGISVTSVARTIHLAGLVVNSQNFKPINAAKIYGDNNRLLGLTNQDGYYNVNLDVNDTGDIHFKIKIAKKGYKSFSDKEHWGDLGNSSNMIMYFGIQQDKSEVASFSDFASNKSSDLNYDNVLSGFEKVKTEKEFEKTLAEAEKGNEDVLFKIHNEYYIADNTGWIKLNSNKDVIRINKKKEIIASEINSVVKRKDIKSMTPVNSGHAKFEIYTR